MIYNFQRLKLLSTIHARVDKLQDKASHCVTEYYGNHKYTQYEIVNYFYISYVSMCLYLIIHWYIRLKMNEILSYRKYKDYVCRKMLVQEYLKK